MNLPWLTALKYRLIFALVCFQGALCVLWFAQWHWSVTLSGMLIFSVCVIHIITHAWQQQYAKLLKETQQQALTQNQASDKANKAKSLFLANMSHEIRTPLNAILGYSQILQRTELSQTQRDGVNTIERSGKHLLDVINDILDLSKIEAGGMELHPEEFDLFDLIDDISAMIALRCEQKNLAWHVQQTLKNPLAVYADQKKLRQILINLLSNAVKFTHHGEIILAICERAEHTYEFSVTDTGIGIPTQEQAQVFLPFRQEAPGVAQEGTGLGLSIAKKHVEIMGGHFTLSSEVNRGSCFSFHVTLAPAKASAHTLSKQQPQNARLKSSYHVTALVVDDIKGNRDVLSILLRYSGLRVIEAVNGQRALDCIAIDPPDIVFLDIQMPVMGGLETLKHIRTDYPDHTIKCVAYTASSFAHNLQNYLQSGFDAFICKPFDVEEVYTCLSILLNVEFDYEGNPPLETAPDLTNIHLTDTQFQTLWDAAELGQITVLARLLTTLKTEQKNLTPWLEHLEAFIAEANTEKVLNALQSLKNKIVH